MSDLPTMRILVVDDTEANIDILVDALGDDYRVNVALDGETALDSLVKNPPDLILLDIMMGGMDGYEVCRRLKADQTTRDIPVIFLTALTASSNEAKGLNLGAVDYITKPFSPDLVKARVRNHLELKLHRDHLEEMVKLRTDELLLTQEVTIESLGTLAEFRDPETGGHIQRTKMYLRLLAEHLSGHAKFKSLLEGETIELLHKSAPLHDIGKVAVADAILLKPGKLNEAEFEEMKKHTVYGRDAIMVSERKLGNNSFLKYARIIAYTHHEKWDGSGYPRGLRGEETPIPGRLMAVADVYDALVSKRPYKKPFSHSKAVSIMLEGRGTHFDPDVADAFQLLADEFRQIALDLSETEEEKEALSK